LALRDTRGLKIPNKVKERLLEYTDRFDKRKIEYYEAKNKIGQAAGLKR